MNLKNFLFSLFLFPFLISSTFLPPKLTFNDLAHPTSESLSYMLSALQDVGLITISQIPGFDNLRKEILSAASLCVLNAKPNDKKLKYIFPDGTVRSTLAAKIDESLEGRYGAFQGVEMDTEVCRRFVELERIFRDKITGVSEMFVERLDEIEGLGVFADNGMQEDGFRLMEIKETGEKFASFESLTRRGFQLEHFHTYERVKGTNEVEDAEGYVQTLDLHTDQGLFITLVPAFFVNNIDKNGNKVVDEDDAHGFYIRLESGEVVKPDFGEGDELVFMIGEFFQGHLNHLVKHPLRSVPHAMQMPAYQVGWQQKSIIRSWYGRMFLPHADSYLDKLGLTFDQFRQKFADQKSLNEVAMAACSDGFAMSTRELLSACDPETQIRCWAACRPSLTCAVGEVSQCLKDLGNDAYAECDPETHDGDCQPTCAPANIEPVEIGNDFCNGFTVSMFMDGFTGVGDPKQQCLVFLFQKFVLDSAMKYLLAALVTVVFGMTVEYVVSLRRKYSKAESHTVGAKLVKILLYALQIAFGYFAMLIAMTYSAVLFCMIVLGLTIGHVMFNFQQPVKEYTEHCCPDPETENYGSPQGNPEKLNVSKQSPMGHCCSESDSASEPNTDSKKTANPMVENFAVNPDNEVKL